MIHLSLSFMIKHHSFCLSQSHTKSPSPLNSLAANPTQPHHQHQYPELPLSPLSLPSLSSITNNTSTYNSTTNTTTVSLLSSLSSFSSAPNHTTIPLITSPAHHCRDTTEPTSTTPIPLHSSSSSSLRRITNPRSNRCLTHGITLTATTLDSLLPHLASTPPCTTYPTHHNLHCFWPQPPPPHLSLGHSPCPRHHRLITPLSLSTGVSLLCRTHHPPLHPPPSLSSLSILTLSFSVLSAPPHNPPQHRINNNNTPNLHSLSHGTGLPLSLLPSPSRTHLHLYFSPFLSQPCTISLTKPSASSPSLSSIGTTLTNLYPPTHHQHQPFPTHTGSLSPLPRPTSLLCLSSLGPLLSLPLSTMHTLSVCTHTMCLFKCLSEF